MNVETIPNFSIESSLKKKIGSNFTKFYFKLSNYFTKNMLFIEIVIIK